MPFDTTPTRPALDVPTLEGLSYMLRHKEMWPEGLEWNFSCRGGCAIGLGDRVWGICSVDGLIDSDADYETWCALFLAGRHGTVTPFMVADRIDAFLARRA